MRWLMVVFLLGCGARTDLGGLRESQDATAPDVPVVPSSCAARDYATKGDPSGNLAVVGGYVYFFENDIWSVVRVPLEGQKIEPVLHDEHLDQREFAVDESWVFYTTNGKVSRVSNAGSGDEPFSSVSNLIVVGITPNAVIVSDETKQLDALSKTDATLAPFFTKKNPTVLPVALVGHDDHVFWMTDEHVFDAALGSQEPYEDDGYPNGIAMNGDDVYWTSVINGTSRLVHRTVSSTDQNVVFTGDLRGPLGANATDVYGVTSGGIARVSVATGQSTLVAPSVFPRRMVIDGTCIYTLDKGGHVRRTPG